MVYESERLTAAITEHFKRIEEKSGIDAETGNAAIATHFKAQAMNIESSHHDGCAGDVFLFERTHRYQIKDEFDKEDLYWIDHVRGSRFNTSFEKGILYRPGIVNDLALQGAIALEKPTSTGIMVKGPGGIGKSHALVNLVRKLIYGSNNKYLVTFIPDCEQWTDIGYLLGAICASCGVAAESFLQQVKGNNVLDIKLLNDMIASIDKILLSMGKKWVFVFDQINKLFVKPMNLHAKDASGLDFPYNFIKLVMKPGRITSIISASANNELAYKESHEGFGEYDHCRAMEKQELLLLYDEISKSTDVDRLVEEVLKETDGVPLFVASYLEKDMNIDAYEAEVIESVRHSLSKLEEEKVGRTWNRIVASSISALLLIETTESLYDKKFLSQERLLPSRKFRYKPLVKQVLIGYREHLWKELLLYVEEKERTLLDICADFSTTNRVRGCHFETMVIRRCSLRNVEIPVRDKTITVLSGDREATGFSGKSLPELPNNGLSFPFDPNFTAIDFILREGKYVFAIQVHVSTHHDVSNAFIGLCNQAQWFQRFEEIHLIYLSPEDEVTLLVAPLVNPPTLTRRSSMRNLETPANPKITRRAISKNSFACLVDMPWPSGCSLNSS